MAQIKVLAEAGGYALLEKGSQLLFVKNGTRWAYSAIFALFLLLPFSLGYGIILLNSYPLFSGILLAVSLALGYGLWRLFNYLKNIYYIPSQLNIHAIIDLEKQELQDGEGVWISPLENVYFEHRMQVFSSAPALVAAYSGRRKVLVRGTPFAGGISSFSYVLKSKGLE